MKTKFFTSLKEAVDVLDNTFDYNWLLSYYDCTAKVHPKQIPFEKDFVWLDGETLLNSLQENPPFSWCVATAYEKEVLKEDVLQYPLPFADGYDGFWTPKITMQNPLAEIEIVLWDASLVLIFSKSPEVVEKYAKEYPDSRDLAEDNQQGLNEALKKALETNDKIWIKSLSDFFEKYKIEKYINPELYREMQERIAIR